jgi:hypothetical protein
VDESVANDLLSVLRGGDDWEAVVFEAACAGARELAERVLTLIDDALSEQRDPGWQVDGYRTRVVVTRMGPVRVRRRLYRVASGKRRRFLLDETMGWTRGRVLSPSLQAIVLKLVAAMPYRKAGDLLDQLVSQSVGRMTLHRLVQQLGEQVDREQEALRAAVYEQGQQPASGTEQAEHLFVEADGLNIALQREGKRRGELKRMVASSGRVALGTDKHGRRRRALTGKVSYGGIEPGGMFWERSWLRIAAHYDLAHTKQVVVGGDGAEWIRKGLDGVTGGLFQLDRFHLARELRRVLGPTGMVAFQAARAGDDVELKRLLGEAWQTAGNQVRCQQELQHLEHYLSANHDGLIDWYRRVEAGIDEPVHLGAIETNMDKPYAQRFKKRGMSWTIQGAQHLAKVIDLQENGELEATCRRRGQPQTLQRLRPASAATTAPRSNLPGGPPFQATFAPRWGPHASRPWVRILCRLIEGPRLRS